LRRGDWDARTSTFLLYTHQFDELNPQLALFDVKSGKCDGQLESPGTRRARIQIEHAVTHFLGGLVRMAADDGRDAGSGRVEVQLVEIVKDVQRPASRFDSCIRGKLPGPVPLIHVAPNRSHGCNLPQSIEHFERAEIARVNDLLGSL